MAKMTYRTTFTLDEATMARIKSLAQLWKVSQAEVVRRAVSMAQSPTQTSSPGAELEKFLRSGSGLDPKIADQYLTEVREDRNLWRGQ